MMKYINLVRYLVLEHSIEHGLAQNGLVSKLENVYQKPSLVITFKNSLNSDQVMPKKVSPSKCVNPL